MKNIHYFSFLVGLLLPRLVAAQPAAAAMVEKPAKNDYRLSPQEFEDTYGFNDTAKAIVRLYSGRLKSGLRIMRYAGVPVPVITALGRHYEPDPRTNNVAPNYSKYYYDPWVPPLAYSLLAVSAFGSIRALTHNRQQLYGILRRYYVSRRLPAEVRAGSLRPYLAAIAAEGKPGRP